MRSTRLKFDLLCIACGLRAKTQPFSGVLSAIAKSRNPLSDGVLRLFNFSQNYEACSCISSKALAGRGFFVRVWSTCGYAQTNSPQLAALSGPKESPAEPRSSTGILFSKPSGHRFAFFRHRASLLRRCCVLFPSVARHYRELPDTSCAAVGAGRYPTSLSLSAVSEGDSKYSRQQKARAFRLICAGFCMLVPS